MLNLPMDHIGLHCSDVELNAKWYQEELGFKVAGKFPGMGGRNVYFLENPQDGKMYEISQRDQLPGGATTRFLYWSIHGFAVHVWTFLFITVIIQTI